MINCILFALLGAGLGSICNMLYFKITTGEPIFSKTPKCGSCASEIHHLDVLPIIGYIRLRGKCRYCGRAIPKKHVLIESFGLILGIVFWTVCI